MGTNVDRQIVELQFNNKNFEQNVQTSIKSIDQLESKLNFDNSAKGFDKIDSSIKKISFDHVSSGAEILRSKFSALEVMGVTALANITNSAVNAGKRIAKSLTIDPIKTGFNEYELKMGSIQTIMASTGESLETVNGYLQELNTYSDKTIYSFSDMTQNIGKFTNAGVKLEDAVKAIQGVSNEAAVSGANAQEASRAMYNFAQALSAGYVKLIDWKSIENANMATVEFKNELLKTAEAAGTVAKNSEGMYQVLTTNNKGSGMSDAISATKNFNDSLGYQWMTTEVLIKTLNRYADETTDIGKKAFAAAQDIKTVSQLFDTLSESVQSGWANTWELIIGDFNEAKKTLTSIYNVIGGFIDRVSTARNFVLAQWKAMGGRANMMTAFSNILKNLGNIISAVSSAFKEIFPPITGAQLTIFSRRFLEFSRALQLNDVLLDKIKRTFKGFFAVLGIGKTIIQKIVSGIFSLFSNFEMTDSVILSATASLGDWLVGLHEMIKSSKIIENVFKGIKKTFEYLIKLFQNGREAVANWYKEFRNLPFVSKAVDKLSENFSGLFKILGNTKKVFSDFIDDVFNSNSDSDIITRLTESFRNNIIPYFGDIEAEIPNMENGMESIRACADNVFGVVGEKVSGAAEKFKGLWQAINEVFTNVDWSKIFGLIVSGGIVVGIIKFANALESLSHISLFGGISNDLHLIFNTIRKDINDKRLKKVASAIKSFAIAVGILTMSFIALSKVPSEKLLTTSLILGGMVAALIAAAVGLQAASTKFESPGIGKMAINMISLAASVRILVSSLVDMNEINTEGLSKKVFAIGEILLVLVGASALASKIKTSGGFLGVIGFALAIKILINSLDDLDGSNMTLVYGTMNILTQILLYMSVLSAAASKTGSGSAMTIIAAALGIKMIVSTLAEISNDGNVEKVQNAMPIMYKIMISFAGLMIASKYAGEHAAKAGIAMVLVGVALKVIVDVLYDMAEIDESTIKKSTKFIIGVLGVFGLVTAFTKFAGENAAKAGVAIILMSGAMALLIHSLDALEEVTPETIDKGRQVIFSIGVVFAGIIGMTKFAKKANSTITMMVVALAALSGLVIMLSSVDPSGLDVATKTIEKLSLCMAGIIAATKIGDFAKGKKSNAFLTLAGVALVMGSVGLVAIELSKVATVNTAPALDSISKMLLAVAGLVGVISVIPFKGAMLGIAALEILIAAMAGTAYTIGLMASELETFKSGAEIMKYLGTAIGNFVGGIYAGFVGTTLEALTETLPAFGQALSTFMTNLQPCITGLGNIPEGILENSVKLAGAILALIAVDVLNAMLSFVTGGIDIDAFNSTILKMGIGLMSFSIIVSGFNSEKVGPAIDATTRLVNAVASLPKIGGWWNYIAGSQNLSVFGDQLVDFGPKLMDFSEKVSTLKGSAATIAAEATAAMVNAMKDMPTNGGIWAHIYGDNSLRQLGKELVVYGPSLKLFSLIVDGINAEAIRAAAKVTAEIISSMKNMPTNGGVWSFIAGDNSLHQLGNELCEYGPGLKSFGENVLNLPAAKVIGAANVTARIIEAMSNMNTNGGIWSYIAGDNSLEQLGNELEVYGPSLKSFGESVIDLPTTKMIGAANVTARIVESMKNMPTNGGMWSYIAGDNSLEQLGNELAAYAIPLASFGKVAEGINLTAVENTCKATSRIIETMQAMPTNGGLWSYIAGDNSLEQLGNELAAYATPLKEYHDVVQQLKTSVFDEGNNIIRKVLIGFSLLPESKGFWNNMAGTTPVKSFASDLVAVSNSMVSYNSNIEKINLPKVFQSISALIRLANVEEMVSKINEKAFRNFVDDFNDMGVVGVDKFIKAFTGADETIAEACRQFITDFKIQLLIRVPGLRDVGSDLSDAVKQGADTESSGFSEVGSHCIKGFVKGLDGNITAIAQAGRKIAREALNAVKKYLGIASPSKEFKKLGKFSVEGFSNAFYDYSNISENASKTLAVRSLDSMKETISKLTESDIDGYEPTIRPILDLSNIKEGMGKVGTMFGGTSISVATARKSTAVIDHKSVPVTENSEYSGSSNSINFTQNNYSPKPLSRYEIYRQTNNQINMIKGLVKK